MVEVAVSHTHKGRRDFVFPPLPEKLPEKRLKTICSQFAKEEMVSRGMVCQCTILKSREVTFSCTTRKIEQDGFGDIVEEWGTIEFFISIKKAFAKVVNDELQRNGLPRTYEFI